MKDCIFCKIVKGKAPARIFYKDPEFIGLLDIYPNTEGMSLVIPKKHYSSDAFEMPDDELKKFIIAVKKVVKILEKKLNCKGVGVIFEGMSVNHLHAKLYPMHKIAKKFMKIFHPKRVFFKKYPGYMTSFLGPKAREEDLERVYRKLIK